MAIIEQTLLPQLMKIPMAIGNGDAKMMRRKKKRIKGTPFIQNHKIDFKKSLVR